MPRTKKIYDGLDRLATLAIHRPEVLTHDEIRELGQSAITGGEPKKRRKRRKRRVKKAAVKRTAKRAKREKRAKKKMSKKLEAAVLAQLKKEVKAGRIKPKRTKANIEAGISPN